MTTEIILNNLAYAFWYVLGPTFLAIAGILIVYTMVLAIYTLIIKR